MSESAPFDLQRLRTLATGLRWTTAALLLILFAATHVPMVVAPGVSWEDKVIHLIAYIGLSFFFLATWETSTGILRPQHYLLVLMGGAVYAMIDELTQIPVGRSCDIFDWLADVIGIVLGIALFRCVRPLVYRRMLATVDNAG